MQHTPPPPAPAPHRKPSLIASDVQSTLKDIKSTLDRTKALTAGALDDKRNGLDRMIADKHHLSASMAPLQATSPKMCSPIWIPRHFDQSGESLLDSEPALLKNMSGDEEEVDTDLETDRLLGHQRLEDHGFYDEKVWIWLDRRYGWIAHKCIFDHLHPRRHGANANRRPVRCSPPRCPSSHRNCSPPVPAPVSPARFCGRA